MKLYVLLNLLCIASIMYASNCSITTLRQYQDVIQKYGVILPSEETLGEEDKKELAAISTIEGYRTFWTARGAHYLPIVGFLEQKERVRKALEFRNARSESTAGMMSREQVHKLERYNTESKNIEYPGGKGSL